MAPRTQLLRYLVVGALAVAIDAGAYYGLTAAHWLDATWAKRVSFALGALWGFFANKFFTFEQRNFVIHEPVLFIFVYIAGWFLNSILHDVILAFTGYRTLAFLIATGTSTCTNYLGQKWIVFRERRPRPPTAS